VEEVQDRMELNLQALYRQEGALFPLGVMEEMVAVAAAAESS